MDFTLHDVANLYGKRMFLIKEEEAISIPQSLSSAQLPKVNIESIQNIGGELSVLLLKAEYASAEALALLESILKALGKTLAQVNIFVSDQPTLFNAAEALGQVPLICFGSIETASTDIENLGLILVASLNEMLADVELKRAAWAKLKPLKFSKP